MEYAISISIVLIFLTLYAFARKKPREVYAKTYSEEEFVNECRKFVRQMPLPKEGSQNEQSAFKRNVRLSKFKLQNHKYDGMFEEFLQEKSQLNSILKIDFSKLNELPSVDVKDVGNRGCESRAVKIARFCLSHSDYKFSQNRFSVIANEQNKIRTLTFDEISSFKEAFIYVLLEKLSFIFEDLKTISKVYDIAKKYVDNPNIAFLDKKIKSYVKSDLFLSLCALQLKYNEDKYTQKYCSVIDLLYVQFSNVFNSFNDVLNFDFSKYYSPLEIYDKYETFAEATERCKENFLKCASQMTDKENIDEFMFAIRLEKLMSSASGGHIKVYRANLFSTLICTFVQRRDIALLALALSSSQFMNLCFNFNDKKSKKSKSISKIVDFENTFEPIYKFKTLNFGISTNGGRLKVSPHLPNEIVSADIVFEKFDTKNTLKILKGDEDALYLGNTKLSGTTQIKLSNKPLDITVIVAKDK